MIRLLAVETSGALCSVALHADGAWFEDTQNVQRLHNQVLLTQIDRLLARAGVAPASLDLLAFGAGPGSFTGIRIAAATAQAIAFAADARMVPVSSSRAMAAAAFDRCAARDDLSAHRPEGIIVVTRSRRDACYVATYAFDGGLPVCRDADLLHLGEVPPPGLPRGGWIGAGDRPPWWAAVDDGETGGGQPARTAENEPAPVSPASGTPGRLFLDDCRVTAKVVGLLALDDWRLGLAVAPEAGLPVYVGGDSPWKPAVPLTDAGR